MTLTEEPTAVDDSAATLAGYPDIQAMIDASLDKLLALVDAAAARSAEPDPRYATLSRTLRQERDGDWATERMLNPDRPDDVTEAERAAIDALMADTPELDAAFGELARELADAYAAIPTIEVSVQHLDQNDKPSGKPYIIRSKNGVIDLGFQTLTVSEFLLWVQSQELRPERGFMFGTSWKHPSWGSGRPWPSDKVKYHFHSSISDGDRTWMWWKLHRTQHATGITFAEYAYSGSRENEWQRGSSPYLRISREELGLVPGKATVGKIGQSFLWIDHGQTHNARGEYIFYHETGHVLGLLHEHQREDRGSYIYVSQTGTDWDRIFKWRNKTILCIFGWCWTTAVQNSTMYDTPYDYHSVSHYESDARRYITLRPSGNTWDVWSKNKSVWGAETTTRILRLGTFM